MSEADIPKWAIQSISDLRLSYPQIWHNLQSFIDDAIDPETQQFLAAYFDKNFPNVKGKNLSLLFQDVAITASIESAFFNATRISNKDQIALSFYRYLETQQNRLWSELNKVEKEHSELNDELFFKIWDELKIFWSPSTIDERRMLLLRIRLLARVEAMGYLKPESYPR